MSESNLPRKVSAVFTDDSGQSATVEIEFHIPENRMEIAIRNTDPEKTIDQDFQESLAAGMATAFVEGFK